MKRQKQFFIACALLLPASAVIMWAANKWYVYLFLIPLVSAIVMNLISAIVRRNFTVQELKKHHELAGFIVTTLGAIYGVIVAFTIVNAQDHLTQLKNKVSVEAYLAADLFKVSEGLPSLQPDVYRVLSKYLKSVIQIEWPMMSKGVESPVTIAHLRNLWSLYSKYTPKTEKEAIWLKENLEVLVQLNSSRLERVYLSWEYLSVLSWLALIVGGLIMLAFLFFFGSENTGFQIAINSAYTFLITFLFVITFYFNRPFEAPIKIQPEAYSMVYNYYNLEGDIVPEANKVLKAD